MAALHKIDKRLWLVLVFFLGVLAINLPNFTILHERTHLNVTIAYANHPAMALLYVAQEQGFFGQEGVAVNYHPFYAGRDALNEVVEGKADLATVYETPFVRKVFEGQQIRAVSTLHTSSRNTQIIALRDRGVNAAQDLKGKKIGLSKGTSAEYYLYSFLPSEGIKPEDVTVVDIAPDKYEETFDSGLVDALVLWNPNLIKLQKKYGDKAVSFNSDVYTEFSLLVGQEKFMAEHPQTVAAVLRALVKAKGFLDSNQEQAKADTVKFLNSQNPEEIYDSWDHFTPTLKLNNLLLSILELEARWFKDNGAYQSAVPDYRPYIYDLPLRQIKPEAVTLF